MYGLSEMHSLILIKVLGTLIKIMAKLHNSQIHTEIVNANKKFKDNATNHNLIDLLRICTNHKDCSIPIVLYKDIMNSPFVHDEHVLYELAKNLVLSKTSSSELIEVCSALLDFPNISEKTRKTVAQYYYTAASKQVDRYTYYPEKIIPQLSIV